MHLPSLGLEISFGFNGKAIEPDRQGSLGQLPMGSLSITVESDPKHEWYAIDTADLNDIFFIPDASLQATRKKYQLEFHIRPEKPLEFPYNNVRLLQVKNKGIVGLYRLGIIQLPYENFALLHHNYDMPCFCSPLATVVCPEIVHFPGMQKVLREVFGGRATNLLPIASYRPRADAGAVFLEKGPASVSWYDPFTMIGKVRAHWGDIQLEALITRYQIQWPLQRPLTLMPGTQLNVRRFVQRRKPHPFRSQSLSPSRFLEWEAQEVEII